MIKTAEKQAAVDQYLSNCCAVTWCPVGIQPGKCYYLSSRNTHRGETTSNIFINTSNIHILVSINNIHILVSVGRN